MSDNRYGPYNPDGDSPPGVPPHASYPHPPRPHHPHQQFRAGPYPSGSRHPYPPGSRPVPPAWRAPYQMPPPPPPAYPLFPPPEPEPSGYLWAFTPFFTLGFGTPFTFLYAAARRRSAGHGLTAAGYGGALALVFTLVNVGVPALDVLGGFLLMLLWIGGTVHTLAVRPSVFPPTTPPNRMNQHAVQVAKYRRALREEARALVAEDPALAHELRIGRPDLPRAYDDGGLIDVNNAAPQALATLPGMTDELVARVVKRRRAQGGFVSAEELALDVDYPADALPKLAEYAIFLP
ncbi:helix-hairpin-helix domain-containing protein [Actinomadura namibiensis]|uniref:helix-hairpin-helix domain-containing protein n=1 Tax=Actinomadura kijaniata TaxID=46161 RepID=UPI003606A49A